VKKYFSSIFYLLSIQAGAFVLFSLFRLLLFIQNLGMLQPDSLGQTGLQMIAFVRGWWFDAVTSSYILMIPLVIATVCALADIMEKGYIKR
jgi:hypothetical protein